MGVVVSLGFSEKIGKIVPSKKRSFKFDTAWLKNKEFLPKVEMIWK
jgi:hypothetical protein